MSTREDHGVPKSIRSAFVVLAVADGRSREGRHKSAVTFHTTFSEEHK
jgi:hypothetical protein